ncbi:MAG: transaldolase [Planctomycetota bacterium]|nr:MAG: transaldolase [Planctomycetota bacterium]
MTSTQPLLKLIEFGQSYWLDNLTRGMIHDGELARRVEEEGLRGVTSNPKIFQNAISKSDDYDEQIEQLTSQAHTVDETYERIVVKDVQDACDVLRPVYDESQGDDGYVSLEVSPHLAHLTSATMRSARHLYAAVDRPNVLIKIPGTAACLPAIEQMLYEGVNVNITLLFSVKRYKAVAQAYQRALERRLEEGQPVHDVSSVASFFLSRIDVLVDELLQQRIVPGESERLDPDPEQLLGEAAIANAKTAYQAFRRAFRGERWEKLSQAGARVQRVLWASTSTKNPDYPDVRYVEPLIGPHTVNTMPDETIAAFADHGQVQGVTITKGIGRARDVVKKLKSMGIDLEQVAWQLEHEGVQKFIEPFDELIASLAEKRDACAVS